MRANPLTEQPWYIQFFKGDYLRIYGHTLQQDRTDLETHFAIHALDLQPNDHVLDLCCGQGRHSIALAKTGLSVTGVDLSEEMLAIAKQNALHEKVSPVNGGNAEGKGGVDLSEEMLTIAKQNALHEKVAPVNGGNAEGKGGVDLSEEMLAIAKQNALDEKVAPVNGGNAEGKGGATVNGGNAEGKGGVTVNGGNAEGKGGVTVNGGNAEGKGGPTFRQADMRHLPHDFENRFDAVINMFSSFGYLESEHDDQQVLHQIAKSLKPRGKLLIDLLNREWVIINNEEFDWHQHEDGRIILERRQLDLQNSINHLSYTEILPDGSRNEMSDLHMRLYSLTELTKMLTVAGLNLEHVYGGFRGEDYGVDTRRMIVVANKPT